MADSILKNSNNSMKIKPFVCGCDKQDRLNGILLEACLGIDLSASASLKMTMRMTVLLVFRFRWQCTWPFDLLLAQEVNADQATVLIKI